MASIEDLKQGNQTENATINILEDEPTQRVQRHRVITPKNTQTSSESEDRVVADLTNLPKDESNPGVDIKEDLAKSILVGADSPFGKYVAEKTEEAREYLERKEIENEIEGVADEEVDQENNEPDFLGRNSDNYGKNNSQSTIGNDSIGSPSTVFSNKLELVEDNNFEKREDEEMSEVVQEVTKENMGETYKIESEEIDTVTTEEPVEVPEEMKEVVVESEGMSEDEKETLKDAATTLKTVEEMSVDPELSMVEGNIDVEEDSLDGTIVEESETELDDDESLKKLQALATERLKPLSQSLNINSFTVLKKPTTNLKSLESKQLKAAKWVAFAAKCIIMMKEFLGSELENLRELSENNRDISALYRKYRILYDHIVSAKPATYEAWLKSTSYSDLDHYFFAAYIASFKGTNYIPLECTNNKCKEQFISNDIPIMDMVKFDSDEIKATFKEIYESDAQVSNPKGIYVSEIVPLSENLAIGFKDASIYSLLEIMALDQNFRNKYSTVVDLIPYIDALYIIDQSNHQIIPIGYKIYPDNATKTIKSKIATYAKALKSLSVDEFGPIRSYINTITRSNSGISYRYPSVECPKCHTAVPEQIATAEELVFIRYQLGALVNTSLK